MKIIFMANIGNSDVYYDGKRLADIGEPRPMGDDILKNWQSKRSKITIPIVSAALESVKKETRITANEIILFATDQPETEKPQHRAKDTIHYAEIARKKICEDFVYSNDCVKIIKINWNPSDYDKMMNFFAEYFVNLKESDKSYENAYTFISITGGTPQTNTGLLINAIANFSHNTQAIYVSEKNGAKKLDIVGNILNKKYSDTAVSMAQNYDYASLLTFIERWNAPKPYIKQFIYVNQYLYDLNFMSAKTCLEQALTYGAFAPSISLQLKGITEKITVLYDAQKLLSGYQRKKKDEIKVPLSEDELNEFNRAYALLIEYWFQKMKISWNKGNFYEFSDLLFGFVENAAKYLITEIIGIPVLKAYFDDVKKSMLKVSGFSEYAKKKDLNMNYEPNNYLYKLFLENILKTQYLKERGKIVSNCLIPLFESKESRNEAVHLFGSSSKENFQNERIEKLCKDGKNFMDIIYETVGLMNIKVNEYSPLDDLNQLIIEELKQCAG